MMRTQVTDALTTSLSPKRMLLAVVVLLVPMSVLVSAGGACYLSKYRLALRSDGESNEVSKTGANPVRWFNFSNIPLVRSSTYHPCLKTICFSVRRVLGSNDSKCNEILPKP